MNTKQSSFKQFHSFQSLLLSIKSLFGHYFSHSSHYVSFSVIPVNKSVILVFLVNCWVFSILFLNECNQFMEKCERRCIFQHGLFVAPNIFPRATKCFADVQINPRFFRYQSSDFLNTLPARIATPWPKDARAWPPLFAATNCKWKLWMVKMRIERGKFIGLFFNNKKPSGELNGHAGSWPWKCCLHLKL